MQKKEQIASILAKVHSTFKYVTDVQQYGEREVWALPTEVGGDCEDFALACRKLVREAGIESRLALCCVETGEMHCVLLVDIRKYFFKTTYVLDNRFKVVRKKQRLPYRWLAASGLEAGQPWRAIQR